MDTEGIKRLNQLKAKLADNPIIFKEQKIYNGITPIEFQQAINQFLIQRLLLSNFKFNALLLEAINKGKSITYPMPPEWRTILTAEGIRMPNLKNRISWFFFKLKWLAYGIYLSAKVLVSNTSFFRKQIDSNFVYVDNLTKKNFPENQDFVHAKNIINWLVRYHQYKKQTIIFWLKGIQEHVISGNIVKSMPYVVTPVPLAAKEFLLLFFGLFSRAIQMLFLLFTSSFEPLLFKEYSLLTVVNRERGDLSKAAYFFHGSTLIFRPLWTYAVEKKGSKVISFLYSTHNSPYSTEHDFDLTHGFRDKSSWSNFYVWNEYQKKYFSFFRPNAKIKIVGPIWFEAHKSHNVTFSANKLNVLIFDLRPLDRDLIRNLALEESFNYTEEYLNDYNTILLETLSSIEGVSIYYKSKRNFNKNFHSLSYEKNRRRQRKRMSINYIDPEADVFSLIENADIVFSPPFISTANVAQNNNIKNAYFDPWGKIKTNPFLAHGNPVLSTKNEIVAFVKAMKPVF